MSEGGLPSAAAIGDALPRYRIDAQVGRGGMSVVYLAEDLGPLKRKRVALKVLAPALASDERFRTRFIRESEIVANLEHPHVIPVYDAGDADGLLYLVMRYIDGPDLRALLLQDGPIPPARLARLLTQVAGALDAAHRQGLVHRDVKPANIMVDRAGEPDEHCYLCDFGITKQTAAADTLTDTGQFIGTLDYIAPEQIQGEPLDGRTDVYALGCLVYQCLTGRVPYPSDTDVAKLWAHVQEPVPSVRAAMPSLPAALDDVVARAMAKTPDDRYATCGELAAALTAAADAPATAPADETVDRPVATTSPSSSAETAARPAPAPVPSTPEAEPTPSVSRRPLVVAGLVGAVVVAAVVVFVLAGRGGDGFPDEDEEAVLAMVPAGYRDTCERTPDGPDGVRASVDCRPDGGAERLVLTSYATKQATASAFAAALKASPLGERDTRDCAESARGSHAFANGKNQEGKVLCFRRGTAESVVVWTVPGASVLGRAERDDDEDDDLYRWWATLVDRPDADTFPTSAESTLIELMHDDIAATCERYDGNPGAAVAALTCHPETGPPLVYYSLFPSRETMDAYYQEVLDAAGLAADSGDPGTCPAEAPYSYTSTGAQGGRRVCYYEGTAARLTTTENSTKVVTESVRHDGNAAALYEWDDSGVGGTS